MCMWYSWFFGDSSEPGFSSSKNDEKVSNIGIKKGLNECKILYKWSGSEKLY